eukprot:IDg5273t1
MCCSRHISLPSIPETMIESENGQPMNETNDKEGSGSQCIVNAEKFSEQDLLEPEILQSARALSERINIIQNVLLAKEAQHGEVSDLVTSPGAAVSELNIEEHLRDIASADGFSVYTYGLDSPVSRNNKKEMVCQILAVGSTTAFVYEHYKYAWPYLCATVMKTRPQVIAHKELLSLDVFRKYWKEDFANVRMKKAEGTSAIFVYRSMKTFLAFRIMICVTTLQ